MERYRNEIIENICRLVAIPSVYEESNSYLFGEPIDRCLDVALGMMHKLGFHTYKAEDGAYGYAELGEGELFGVLGHIDVVSAREEDGWEHNPFVPIIKEGCICGRGVQDDKGPIVLAAYALKSLIDDGYLLNKRVRFIFGTDEETLWRCMSEYTKREEAPKSGFTPDSTFPLTYAEKGLLQILIKDASTPAYHYYGGDSFNAVSAFARCRREMKIEEALVKRGFSYHVEDDEIVVTGLTAHAKNPWKGISANLHLLEALYEAGYVDYAIQFACDILNNQFKFEGFTAQDLSDFSGPVTVNLSKMNANKDGTVFSVDLRLPVGQKKETVLNIIREVASKYHLIVEEYDWLKPIHVPLGSELVTQLLNAYREITGDIISQPYISAGATYARAFDNCVAFGANLPASPTSEHQPNERVAIDDMMKAAEVYRAAFIKCVTHK
ncbi:MAG: dipeptidase [Clostridia bacterium]|jgi:predicted dipeptidase|nr:dipeptidase [Clostridia bacterium]